MRRGLKIYGVFAAPLALLVGVAALVQYYWGGEHLRAAATSAGLMLAGGAAGLALDERLTRTAGPIAAYAVTFSLRVGAGFGGGLAMAYGSDWFVGSELVFWVWLLIMYNAALVAETVTLVRAGR